MVVWVRWPTPQLAAAQPHILCGRTHALREFACRRHHVPCHPATTRSPPRCAGPWRRQVCAASGDALPATTRATANTHRPQPHYPHASTHHTSRRVSATTIGGATTPPVITPTPTSLARPSPLQPPEFRGKPLSATGNTFSTTGITGHFGQIPNKPMQSEAWRYHRRRHNHCPSLQRRDPCQILE